MLYLDLAVILNFAVDWLLLLAANRICGYPASGKRTAAAAALGALYAGMCLLPGFRFLGNGFWRIVFLCAVSMAAFGADGSAVKRGAIFLFLSLALGGLAVSIGAGGVAGLVGTAAVLGLICSAAFREKIGSQKFVPVQIRKGAVKLQMIALYDTGNCLKDPVSGQRVLVAGKETAGRLLGLTPEQLKSPVETLSSGTVPGLRLIPYRAVGMDGGMLLAAKMDQVLVDGKEAGTVVAFAPQTIGQGYQALVGGM